MTTAAEWAGMVLTDLGAPQTANNIDNMLAWMASENTWPPPRNNPLNNGLGSGGGSGLGSYPDLATAAEYAAKGMQGGIEGAAGIGQALVNNASFATFHAATISAVWSGDHYAGTDWLTASSPGSMGVQGAPAGSGITPQLAQAVAEGGGPYLAAMYAQSQQQAAAPASTGTSLASDTNIGGVSYVGTQQQTSALSTIEANLQTYGFNPSQVQQLTSWAWGEITNNVDPTQIAIDLQSQPAFLQQFPGFGPANAELQKNGLAAVSVQQYQQYQTYAEAQAQAMGLPAGFINSQNIGTLIGGNVSQTELNARLNDAMVLAIQSTPEQQTQFNEYFGTKYGDSGQGGLTAGQIAAIALDPASAEPLIAQQIKTAQIGGASVTSGVGSLDLATAQQLAQAGITEAQATATFQNIAPLAALEAPRPGMGGEAAQGVVTPEQLALGNLLGSPSAQRQQQTAVEVAKAPFSGGGGFVSNTKGVAGAGNASEVGAGNT
jgi:hypothetical protein